MALSGRLARMSDISGAYDYPRRSRLSPGVGRGIFLSNKAAKGDVDATGPEVP
jgi:hypothetical protein